MKHITLLAAMALSLCACRTERDKDDSWKTYNSQDQAKSSPQNQVKPPSAMNESTSTTATTAGSASGTAKTDPESLASKTTSNSASSTGKTAGTQTETKKIGSTVQAGAGTPSNKAATVGPADNKFIENAIRGGMFEIRSSRLALQKVMSGPTREFAEMMVQDHDKANRELEDLARTLGGTVPTTLDASQQEQLDQLAKLEGKEFERSYHEAQVKAHDGAISLFEKAAKDCESNALKTYATSTLTTLREHRRKLDELPAGT